MSWIDVAWTMMASASLTLALFHLVVWHRQRSEYAYLVFCVLAVSVAGLAAFELVVVRAQTPAEYLQGARLAQVPVVLIVLSIIVFERLYFGAGRMWLACAAGGLRVIVTLVTAASGTTPQFEQVTALDHVAVLGVFIFMLRRPP